MKTEKIKSAIEIASDLKRELGYKFSQFTIALESNINPADIEWNYKDSLHHNFIHETALKQINYNISFSQQASIWNIGMGPFFLPMNILNFQPDSNRQVSVSTFLFFILVIENHWEAIATEKSCIRTNYFIGSSRLFYPLQTLIRILLRRNYQRLMKGDFPVRERRKELRDWGYRFKNGVNSHFSYKIESDIEGDFLDWNSGDFISPDTLEIPIARIGKSFLIGRSDHWGLELVRNGSDLSIFPRICIHEGACLDRVEAKNGFKTCPWHGRKNKAIASFSLEREQFETDFLLEKRTKYHIFQLSKDQLKIQFFAQFENKISGKIKNSAGEART